MSTPVDEITSALERFNAAWKANDGGTLGGFFVDDGVLINPFGERADGRAAVAAMYTKYFGGMLSGTSTVTKIASVRRVESHHAFVDGEQTVYATDGSIVLVVHLAALMRRDDDRWRFVDARPYTYATRPV